MLQVDYNIELGRIRIEQNGKKFDLGIYPANCEFGAVVWRGKNEKGKDVATLMTFWADEQHCKNIIKNEGSLMCGEKVLSVELNMYYKENYKLLKYMMLSGYEVKCYHKEPASE
jgi:hypothetical protein